jgi:hypothetical protein
MRSWLLGSLTKIYNTWSFICENIQHMGVFTKISTVNGDPVVGDRDTGHAIAGNWNAAKTIAGNPVASRLGQRFDFPICCRLIEDFGFSHVLIKCYW